MFTSLALDPSCLTQTWASSRGGTESAIILGNPYDTNCWPVGRQLSTTISPAICPVGYVSACDGSSRRDASETVWACCPKGFHCDPGYYSCLSDATAGTVKTYIATDTDQLGNTIFKTWITDGGINAHSIRVAFHSSDIDPSPSSTAHTPPATGTPTAGNLGGLSAGAAAGVGVGGGIGVFLLLSSAAWLAWRRYRRKRLAASDGLNAPEQSVEPNSCRYPIDPSAMGIPEMDASPGLQELETKRKAGELCTNR